MCCGLHYIFLGWGSMQLTFAGLMSITNTCEREIMDTMKNRRKRIKGCTYYGTKESAICRYDDKIDLFIIIWNSCVLYEFMHITIAFYDYTRLSKKMCLYVSVINMVELWRTQYFPFKKINKKTTKIWWNEDHLSGWADWHAWVGNFFQETLPLSLCLSTQVDFKKIIFKNLRCF